MINLFNTIKGRDIHLERSFIVQRTWFAFLGAMFPVAFLASSFLFDRTEFQTSISAYYWTLDLERNLFVGGLCGIAVFFLLYKGFTLIQDRIIDMAGLSAVGMAFFPMDRSGGCTSSGVSAHGVFSVLFFACIFYLCIFMSKITLGSISDVNRRKSFSRAYGWCSGIMIGCVAFSALSRYLPKEYVQTLCEKSIIFWIEAVGVWAFSAFWYIKTRELDTSRSWVPFLKKRET